jgi:DNA-binding NarL/FixJ family response regulator
VRVLICEDLALLRDGLTRLLEDNGMEVVAAVADGDRLVSAAFGHKPDVCVVDVRLPPTFRDEGLRAALAARERLPGLPVLILSQYVERTYAAELLADGVGGVGYLLKDRVGEVEEFVRAVRTVAGGGTVLDPEVVAQILARRRTDELEALTPREHEVLTLMAEGRSNQAIAETLVVTPGAVEKHVSSIFGKARAGARRGAQPARAGGARLPARRELRPPGPQTVPHRARTGGFRSPVADGDPVHARAHCDRGHNRRRYSTPILPTPAVP